MPKAKFKLDIKHPSYEVILPMSSTKVLVRGLTLRERTIIASNTINKSSSINIMMNVIYDAISNKEIFNNDYDFFLKSIGWSDLKALVVGVLIQSNRLSKSNLSLKAQCPHDSCKKEFPIKMQYNEVVTSVKMSNEVGIFEKEYTRIVNDDVEIKFSMSNMYTELVVANITEMIMNDAALLDKYKFSTETLKLLAYSILSKCTMVKHIKQGDSILEFNYDIDDPNVAEDALEFITTITHLESLDEDIEGIVNPEKYGLSTKHKFKCPHCKKDVTIDLDDWLVDQLLPPTDSDL